MTQLRILYVEDVEDDAFLVVREIRRSGYDVVHRRVETPAALEEALRAEEWNLLISDYSLPRLTAMDVLKTLAASGLDLPCIVISGTIGEDAAVAALKAGARDFIVKGRLARLMPAIDRELREAAERRQKRDTERALSEARHRLQFALEAAGVGFWEADIRTDRMIWSDVFERLHGVAAGTFAGTFEAFIDAVHPDDRRSVREQIGRSTRDQSETQLEYRVLWSDGSVHWISGVGHTFYDDAGQPVRAVGIGLDVTAQRTLEEQYRQAQRMESIGNLAGGIAHDFNNLLTAILGYSDFLLEELRGDLRPELLREHVEEIRHAGRRAADLTGQLLTFSRKQIIQPRIINLNDVIANLAPLLRRLIDENIALTLRMDEHLGAANADTGQIEQILMNLVVNARDAMPDGGKLSVETANVDLDGAYARSHLAVVPGPYVMLAVSDTGTGMSAMVQARIFEPFFTTKPAGRGTGLGLATVYGIVKQNHGNIWVYSEEGKGTTFKVYVPRVAAAAPAVVQGEAPVAAGGTETVLLVEDDQRVRTLASEILRRRGYRVIPAADGEEAIRLAAEHEGSIHLVLSDVVMPGRSGHLLARELVARHPHLKILYMSGYTDNTVVHHGVLDPGVAFIQKPFTAESLARAVRLALDGAPQP